MKRLKEAIHTAHKLSFPINRYVIGNDANIGIIRDVERQPDGLPLILREGTCLHIMLRNNGRFLILYALPGQICIQEALEHPEDIVTMLTQIFVPDIEGTYYLAPDMNPEDISCHAARQIIQDDCLYIVDLRENRNRVIIIRQSACNFRCNML